MIATTTPEPLSLRRYAHHLQWQVLALTSFPIVAIIVAMAREPGLRPLEEGLDPLRVLGLAICVAFPIVCLPLVRARVEVRRAGADTVEVRIGRGLLPARVIRWGDAQSPVLRRRQVLKGQDSLQIAFEVVLLNDLGVPEPHDLGLLVPPIDADAVEALLHDAFSGPEPTPARPTTPLPPP